MSAPRSRLAPTPPLRPDWLELKGVADHEAAPERPLRIGIATKGAPRMTVEGAEYDGPAKVLNLGILEFGKGRRERLVWTVRDEHAAVVVNRVEADPPWLDVRVEAIDPAGNAGVYRIEVAVPPTAPVCTFVARRGRVRLVTDHPAIPEIAFDVAFAIRSAE